MTTKKPATTLSAALAAAQAMATRIDKDGRNDFQRYDYTSAENMMQLWTEIAGSQGLSLYPARSQVKGELLKCRWILEHGPTGAGREIRRDEPIVVSKGKPLDKAIASARTTGLGYLIRDLLIVPRVHPTDDMDHPRWSQPEKKAAPPAPAPRKRSPQKPAKASAPAESAKPQTWASKHAERLLAAGLTPEEAEGVAYRIRGETIDESWTDERLDGLVRFVIEDERGRKVLDAVRAER
jgi:hypothetical protein